MARSRSSTRVHYSNPNRMLRYESWSWVRPVLQEFEDRRAWHPLGDIAPARSFSQSRHRLIIPNARKMSVRLRRGLGAASPQVNFPSASIGFEAPKRVLICVRRSIRREVMHALRFAGRGGGRQRHPRRSEYSNVHC